jgi:hypothetical protein
VAQSLALIAFAKVFPHHITRLEIRADVEFLRKSKMAERGGIQTPGSISAFTEVQVCGIYRGLTLLRYCEQ